MTLKVIALSVEPGGRLGEIHVGGAVTTSGRDVVTVELAGPVGAWDVGGAIVATGAASDAVRYTGEGAAPTGVKATSELGRDAVEVPTTP